MISRRVSIMPMASQKVSQVTLKVVVEPPGKK